MTTSILNKLQAADKRETKRVSKLRYGRPTLYITKAGMVNKHIQNALSNCEMRGTKIYPFMWSGSGNHINATDNSAYVLNLLAVFGFKYEKGNDAPRGGKNGDYIKVSKRAIEVLTQIKSA